MDTATRSARRTVSPGPRVLRLADGTVLDVRSTRTDDRSSVAALLRQLSPHARYLRFLQAVPDVPEWAVDSLSRTDDDVHAGLIALDEAGLAVAVAQFFVVPGAPDEAELAVTIAPAYQRRGVGAALIAVLAAEARARRIDTFTYVASPANRPAIELMRSVGARARFEHGLIHGRVAVDRVRHARRTRAVPSTLRPDAA
jgi:acetyltransferase